MQTSSGIHHITAITGDPRKNIEFYEGFLGQRLVKRTVNFDDPSSYHFYFGDAYGKPGTLITFFFWKGIPKGTRGTGEVSRIAYTIEPAAKEFWITRARIFGVTCTEGVNEFGEPVLMLRDPDDMTIELMMVGKNQNVDAWGESDVSPESMLGGFYGATLTVVSIEEMETVLAELGYAKQTTAGEHARFVTTGERATILDVVEAPDLPQSRQGSGSVHHIAFRATGDAEELEMRAQIEKTGSHPTPVIDRQYFHSVYFMTPGRILFEIATDSPGFAIDEPKESLGEHLVLPPMYEPHRAEIEKTLLPVSLPRHDRK